MRRIIIVGKNSDFPRFTPKPVTTPAKPTIADRIIDAMTVISGLALFSTIAMFFLVLA